MNKSYLRAASAAVMILGLMDYHAFGFGDNGHIAVAKVADKYLTNGARQKIDQILGGKKIYYRKICMFADTYKHTHVGEHTKPWHYADIPFDQSEYKASRDCVGKDCVVARIKEQKAILKDPNAQPEARAIALKFLIHLVGDIHQPLHCCERNGDVGGNEVHVRFLDHQGITNLHAIWDGNILEENMQADDPEDYADIIQARITAQQKAEWEQTTSPVKWANEGHQLAIDFAYHDVPAHSPAPFHIEATYVNRAKPVIETQIQKAGVRLAKLLNDALE